MAEAGIDMSGQTSKHVDELQGIDFDYVVTLCDAAKEQCPVFSGDVKHIHRAFDDPTSVIGTPEQVWAAFRSARDQIKAFVEKMPENLSAIGTL